MGRRGINPASKAGMAVALGIGQDHLAQKRQRLLERQALLGQLLSTDGLAHSIGHRLPDRTLTHATQIGRYLVNNLIASAPQLLFLKRESPCPRQSHIFIHLFNADSISITIASIRNSARLPCPLRRWAVRQR